MEGSNSVFREKRSDVKAIREKWWVRDNPTQEWLVCLREDFSKGSSQFTDMVQKNFPAMNWMGRLERQPMKKKKEKKNYTEQSMQKCIQVTRWLDFTNEDFCCYAVGTSKSQSEAKKQTSDFSTTAFRVKRRQTHMYKSLKGRQCGRHVAIQEQSLLWPWWRVIATRLALQA